MLWSLFISAIGLLFVFEGILPFLSPALWRRLMKQMMAQTDRALRLMGLMSMLIGLILICVVHDLF